jgi:hypothetical protein
VFVDLCRIWPEYGNAKNESDLWLKQRITWQTDGGCDSCKDFLCFHTSAMGLEVWEKRLCAWGIKTTDYFLYMNPKVVP